MRISLLMGAARASAAAALFVLLGAPAALSHATPFGLGLRVVTVHGHPQWGASRGWTNAWAWRGQNGWSRSNRWIGWGRNAWRWNGWGPNGQYWNQAGLAGFGYWSSPYASADPATTPGGDGPQVVIGAPEVTFYPATAPQSFDGTYEGGCVIHKLIYDRSGKYVGERQTPEC
jgi:hypothetical protein